MLFLIEEGFAHDLKPHSPISPCVGFTAAAKWDLGH
jgi:hypothetical protein